MKIIHKALISLGIYGATLPLFAQQIHTLKSAINTAREQNMVLKSIAYAPKIAEGDVTTAKLLPNPILNNQTLLQLASGRYDGQEIRSPFFSQGNRQFWLQATMPNIPFHNQRKNKVELATKNVELLHRSYADAERQILYETASNWLEAWHRFIQIEVSQNAKTNVDSLVETNKIRLKNQVITISDLQRTQVLSDQYALKISNAQQDYRNQLFQLRLSMGVSDSITIDTHDDFSHFTLSSRQDSLLAQALRQRTDLNTVLYAREVAASNTKLQKSLAKPRPELGIIWNPQNSTPYFGWFATIPLAIYDKNQGEIQKARVVEDQAYQNQLQVEFQINTEVRTAYYTYQVQKKNLDKLGQISSMSDQILSTVKYSYLRGNTTIIDLLDAERSWYETRILYFETLYNYRKSYLDLLFVTGNLSKLTE